MKLAEWQSISKERQRELLIEYAKGDAWFTYENMAFEAATKLMGELSSISNVTNVEPSGGEIVFESPPLLIQELDLIVYTLLSGSMILECIPNRYKGFGVRQLNLGDKRESYLKTWEKLFKELKGWDAGATLEWAKKWDDALTGRRPSAIYHYGPVKMALSALVDEDVKKAVGPKLQLLYNEIKNVIENTETVESIRIEHPDTAENYNWEQVRTKILRLTDMYSKLNSTRQP